MKSNTSGFAMSLIWCTGCANLTQRNSGTQIKTRSNLPGNAMHEKGYQSGPGPSMIQSIPSCVSMFISHWSRTVHAHCTGSNKQDKMTNVELMVNVFISHATWTFWVHTTLFGSLEMFPQGEDRRVDWSVLECAENVSEMWWRNYLMFRVVAC